MEEQYHILNGDALKEQFPKEIPGERIVARECLVDGNVAGDTLDRFFRTRAQFITEFYGDASEQDYYRESVAEFEKIRSLPDHAIINLWFEDDLFCQVNFWFVVYLLSTTGSHHQVFLVRPDTHTPYGFGALDRAGLISLHGRRVPLWESDKVAGLWIAYQKGDTDELLSLAKALEATYPFILPAVKAHVDRIPAEGNKGRPARSLLQIMNELNTDEFGPVFREFCKRESIYGFGDLQVKRLYDEVKGSR